MEKLLRDMMWWVAGQEESKIEESPLTNAITENKIADQSQESLEEKNLVSSLNPRSQQENNTTHGFGSNWKKWALKKEMSHRADNFTVV